MDEYIEKHLIDVLNAINEVESFFADRPKLFQEFQNDMLRQRAVERNIEIMGEAINRILKANPEFQLPNAKAIINTRNRVIHGYDSVTTEFLWSLIMKHIPALKNDVENMFRRMCFNVFAHNRDDHSKNFTFLYDEENDSWRLSPAYDLTYSNTYYGEHTTAVDGNGRNPGEKEILAVGIAAGMNKEKCLDIMKEIEASVKERLGEYL